jgi:hypothetical protein
MTPVEATEVELQRREIEMPSVCASKVNGQIRATETKETAPAGHRLSGPDPVQNGMEGIVIQADSAGNIALL